MTTNLIVWKCAACGGPVFDGCGYVAAPYPQITDDGAIVWDAWHDACQPEADSYWIPVEGLRTPEQARGWAAHLAGKNWYERSNWRDLLAGHGVDVAREEADLEVSAELLAELSGKAGPW